MDTTRLSAQTLTCSLSVNLRSPEGLPVPVASQLTYDSGNPYALTIAFHVNESPVLWTFARELLSVGLTEPTGDGDVHVWPGNNDEGDAVVTKVAGELVFVEGRARSRGRDLARAHAIFKLMSARRTA